MAATDERQHARATLASSGEAVAQAIAEMLLHARRSTARAAVHYEVATELLEVATELLRVTDEMAIFGAHPGS